VLVVVHADLVFIGCNDQIADRTPFFLHRSNTHAVRSYCFWDASRRKRHTVEWCKGANTLDAAVHDVKTVASMASMSNVAYNSNVNSIYLFAESK